MSVIYTHLTYEAYKELERQMRDFRETSHKTERGFYHKSIRLKVGDDLIMEFHGPLVGGYGHRDADDDDAIRTILDTLPEPEDGDWNEWDGATTFTEDHVLALKEAREGLARMLDIQSVPLGKPKKED